MCPAQEHTVDDWQDADMTEASEARPGKEPSTVNTPTAVPEQAPKSVKPNPAKESPAVSTPTVAPEPAPKSVKPSEGSAEGKSEARKPKPKDGKGGPQAAPAKDIKDKKTQLSGVKRERFVCRAPRTVPERVQGSNNCLLLRMSTLSRRRHEKSAGSAGRL